MRSLAPLADLAERQHGLATYRQMRELGLSNGHIHRASKASRLRRVHRGVYAVGHKRLSRHGRCLAAALACGEGAVLSHRSAAWLWGLFPNFPSEPEVTAAGRGHRRSRIRVHRVAALASQDCRGREGIPVTTIPRTLIDLAEVASSRELSRAVDRARRLGRLDLNSLDQLLARRNRTAGAKRLRKALDLYRRPAFEVDGWETHGSREAFESDRVRLEEMKLAGIDCIPISARRIEKEPHQVAKRIRILLSRRRLERDRT